jgi:hypothetical protein
LVGAVTDTFQNFLNATGKKTGTKEYIRESEHTHHETNEAGNVKLWNTALE